MTAVSALSPERWDSVLKGAELITWMRNSRRSEKIKYHPYGRTRIELPVCHFYLKIHMETGVPLSSELPGSEGALGFPSVTSDSCEL